MGDLGKPTGELDGRGPLRDVGAEVLAEINRVKMIVDGDKGEIIEANDAAYRLFGQPLAGANISRLIPERYQHAHDGHLAHFMERMIARPMKAEIDVRATTKDRGEIPVRIALTPVPGERVIIVELDPL